tara:strand:+ start:1516 stop:3960 length:2445 start_codon:yes stop_codon:yes gene_type:complete
LILKIWNIGALLCVLLVGVGLNAQHSLKGEILDAKTRDPLPFVNVIANDSGNGTATNIDGAFQLSSKTRIQFIQVSYVGYEKQIVPILTDEPLIVLLQKTKVSLRPVNIFPDGNPAHRIILKTYSNSDKNNPEKSGSFEYETYMKMKGILDVDSTQNVDTEELDSTTRALMSFIETSDLFIMETVTHRKFRPPNHSKETILATKVSGFKNPDFGLITSQMGSFTFYDEKFTFGDREYVNPISKNSINKYLFILEDTVINGPDSTYIISFRPRYGKRFDALKGLLYINTNGYALEHVTAEPVEYQSGINVTIQQSYERVNNQKWFPSEIKTDFTILIDTNDSKFNFRGTLRGFFLNIKLDPEFKRKEFSHVAIELDPMATKKTKEYWEAHRVLPLTDREITTYQKVDSVSKELNIERNFFILNGLLSGVVPYRFIDFDLDHILRFNRYEGLGLGLGIHTNDKFSKHIKLGGYFNYGFGDKTWKYGGDISYSPIKGNEFQLKAVYKNDVVETGGTEWYIKTRSGFSSATIRPMFISLKDQRELYQLGVQFRSLNYLQAYVFGNYDIRKTTDRSTYISENGTTPTTHTTAEVGVHLRYAYGEAYMPVNGKLFSLGTKSPILHFKYTRGIKGIEQSGYDYNKFDFKVVKLFSWRALGKSTGALTFGYSDATLPKTFLYNAPATYFSSFPIGVDQSFQTMRTNEFFADMYLHLFLKHSFPKINSRWDWFKPTAVIYHNMGYGELTSKNLDRNPGIQDYWDGFYESGFGFDHLYTSSGVGIGLSTMYRYGPRALPYHLDNWAVKLTMGISLNFGASINLE